MSTFKIFVASDGLLVLRQKFPKLADKWAWVTVEGERRSRSLDQNAWLWGYAYPHIAEHCGYDAHEHEQLHYDLLTVRFGTEAVSPVLPGAHPRIVPARTSSTLSTKEFSDYMEWLARYAAEHLGVVLELPDERLQEAQP